ncbi:hypothetical protein NM688_g8945 [Phlebia brevispora]|uniref:Uncharacterized protein n=1 Tax=Phlebia brevispora TaxID=194682 RepID=A0ACC1RMZ9_9APHY|nr:hypothetical protein NM688_g8945 [Phlebia brevispora]
MSDYSGFCLGRSLLRKPVTAYSGFCLGRSFLRKPFPTSIYRFLTAVAVDSPAASGVVSLAPVPRRKDVLCSLDETSRHRFAQSLLSSDMSIFWRARHRREGIDPFQSERFRLESSASKNFTSASKRLGAADASGEVRTKSSLGGKLLDSVQQQRQSKRSMPVLLSGLLFLFSSIILQLCLAVFVAPRIQCSSLPSPINSLCPSIVVRDGERGVHVHKSHNLAFLTNGAKLIRQFSHVGIEPPPLFRRLFFSPLSAASYSLDGVVDLAHCWVFQGDQAQLAIRLSNYSAITRIAIEQPYATDEVARSPRQIAVWGLVDGPEDEARLAEQQELYETLLSRMRSAVEHPAKGYHFIPLAAFAYDGTSAGLQTFSVFHNVAALGLEYGVILVQVLSN